MSIFSLVGVPFGAVFAIATLLQVPTVQDQFWETVKNLIVIAATVLLPILAERVRKMRKELDTTPSKQDVKQVTVDTDAKFTALESKVSGLTNELETMRSDYRQVVSEKNQAVESLRVTNEQRRVDEERYQFQTNKLNNLLAEERGTTTKLSAQNADQEDRIQQLEKQIAALTPVNELAHAIVTSMRELAKTRTKEIPTVIPTPNPTPESN